MERARHPDRLRGRGGTGGDPGDDDRHKETMMDDRRGGAMMATIEQLEFESRVLRHMISDGGGRMKCYYCTYDNTKCCGNPDCPTVDEGIRLYAEVHGLTAPTKDEEAHDEQQA